MSRYSFLFVVVALFPALAGYSQTTKEKEVTEDVTKQQPADAKENSKAEIKQAEIKSVPSAKKKHVKPAKVNAAKARTARPQATRPARSARPQSRPARPGVGRN